LLLKAQPEPIQFQHFTEKDGLSHRTINCLLQDRRGFMWFGTPEGLNRFDGYSFRKFKHRSGDSTSLISNIINCLYEDRSGYIWVGHQ
jgi:ligand-binding sensor domain-containing protein